MNNKTKGILINPNTKQITEVIFSGNYNDIYDLIGEEVESIFYSEFRTTKGKVFTYYNFDQDNIEGENGMLINDVFYKDNVLLLGDVTDETDQWTTIHNSCPLSVKDIEDEVDFINEFDLLVKECVRKQSYANAGQ